MLRWGETSTFFSVKRLLQASCLNVLSALEEEETSATAIVYLEPNNGGITDEDSADEDNGGLVDNLSGNQLNTVAETVLPNGRRINNRSEGSETVSNERRQTPL